MGKSSSRRFSSSILVIYSISIFVFLLMMFASVECELDLFYLPGCYDDQYYECDDYPETIVGKKGNGKIREKPLITWRREVCSKDPAKFALLCTESSKIDEKEDITNCIKSTCLPSTIIDRCQTLISYDFKSVYGHTTEAYNEECSIEETAQAGDNNNGTFSVCCKPYTSEGHMLAVYGAEPHEFPHQALLQYREIDQWSDSGCAGTVYNEKWILTAAHCVVRNITDRRSYWYEDPLEPQELRVILGTNIASSSASPKNIHVVKSVHVHERYSRLGRNLNYFQKTEYVKKLLFDVALLELEKEIGFSPKVQALRIAPTSFKPSVFENRVVIVGWGSVDNLRPSDHLQKDTIPLRRDAVCKNAWDKLYTSNQHICIGGIVGTSFGRTADKGYSGGPAICRNVEGKAVLCGITSFGGNDDDCNKQMTEETCQPSVYSKVSYFNPWITRRAGIQATSKTQFFDVPLFGTKAAPTEFPHQVYISSTNKFFPKPCGGTLISLDTVVTAGHCVLYFDQKDGNPYQYDELKVTVGSSVVNGTSASTTYDVDFIVPAILRKSNVLFALKINSSKLHPRLENHYYEDDIAVVKLKQKVTEGPGVKPLKLPESPKAPTGSAVEMAWTRGSPPELRKYDVNLMDRSECLNRLKRIRPRDEVELALGRRDICMVEKYSGGSICDRTLGGGIICKGPTTGEEFLCGIQSFRICDFSLPRVAQDVSKWTTWIKESL